MTTRTNIISSVIDQADAETAKPKTSFLDLPRELRDMVYHLADLKGKAYIAYNGNLAYPHRLALVSRQIRQEVIEESATNPIVAKVTNFQDFSHIIAFHAQLRQRIKITIDLTITQSPQPVVTAPECSVAPQSGLWAWSKHPKYDKRSVRYQVAEECCRRALEDWMRLLREESTHASAAILKACAEKASRCRKRCFSGSSRKPRRCARPMTKEDHEHHLNKMRAFEQEIVDPDPEPCEGAKPIVRFPAGPFRSHDKRKCANCESGL